MSMPTYGNPLQRPRRTLADVMNEGGFGARPRPVVPPGTPRGFMGGGYTPAGGGMPAPPRPPGAPAIGAPVTPGAFPAPQAPMSAPAAAPQAPAVGAPPPAPMAPGMGGGYGGATPGANPGADDPFTGAHGHGWGPNYAQHRLLDLNASNAFGANPLMWQGIYDLQNEGMQDPTNLLASGYGQQFENLGSYYDQAQNRLGANLDERGLGDSSAMGNAMGALEGARAGAQAGLAGQIHSEAMNRQLQARAQMRDLLASLQGRSSNSAAGLASTINDEAFRRAMMNQGPGIFDQLLGGLGGAAGMASGLGFKPFTGIKF